MLKSYEAIYENGQLKWLGEQPEVQSARVIITLLEEEPIVSNEVISDLEKEPELEDLGGSEPQAEAIPRRRYDV